MKFSSISKPAVGFSLLMATLVSLSLKASPIETPIKKMEAMRIGADFKLIPGSVIHGRISCTSALTTVSGRTQDAEPVDITSESPLIEDNPFEIRVVSELYSKEPLPPDLGASDQLVNELIAARLEKIEKDRNEKNQVCDAEFEREWLKDGYQNLMGIEVESKFGQSIVRMHVHRTKFSLGTSLTMGAVWISDNGTVFRQSYLDRFKKSWDETDLRSVPQEDRDAYPYSSPLNIIESFDLLEELTGSRHDSEAYHRFVNISGGGFNLLDKEILIYELDGKLTGFLLRANVEYEVYRDWSQTPRVLKYQDQLEVKFDHAGNRILPTVVSFDIGPDTLVEQY